MPLKTIKQTYDTSADAEAVAVTKQYDDLVARIKSLQGTEKACLQQVKALQADVDGDVATLTQQSLSKKREAEEARAEIEVLRHRLKPLSDKLANAARDSAKKWRQVRAQQAEAISAAIDEALQDKALLSGVKKLKALLHSVDDPKHVMNRLDLSEHQVSSGAFPDEYQQHGFTVEGPEGSANESRMQAIFNFHHDDKKRSDDNFFYDKHF